MENVDVLQHIVEYVGPKQFLFVAMINCNFHEAYSKVFRHDLTTRPNASTIELAKFCFGDLVNFKSDYCATIFQMQT